MRRSVAILILVLASVGAVATFANPDEPIAPAEADHHPRLNYLGCHRNLKLNNYHCHTGLLSGRWFKTAAAAEAALITDGGEVPEYPDSGNVGATVSAVHGPLADEVWHLLYQGCPGIGPVAKHTLSTYSVTAQGPKKFKLVLAHEHGGKRVWSKSGKSLRSLVWRLCDKIDKIESKKPAEILICADQEAIKQTIITRLLDEHDYYIEQDTSYLLYMWRELEGSLGFWAQFLMGNAYSDNPILETRFLFVPRDDCVKIRHRGEIVIRMALGNVNRIKLSGKELRDSVMAFFESVKSEVEGSPVSD